MTGIFVRASVEYVEKIRINKNYDWLRANTFEKLFCRTSEIVWELSGEEIGGVRTLWPYTQCLRYKYPFYRKWGVLYPKLPGWKERGLSAWACYWSWVRNKVSSNLTDDCLTPEQIVRQNVSLPCCMWHCITFRCCNCHIINFEFTTKFTICIYTHPVNSKFTIWHNHETIVCRTWWRIVCILSGVFWGFWSLPRGWHIHSLPLLELRHLLGAHGPETLRVVKCATLTDTIRHAMQVVLRHK